MGFFSFFANLLKIKMCLLFYEKHTHSLVVFCLADSSHMKPCWPTSLTSDWCWIRKLLYLMVEQKLKHLGRTVSFILEKATEQIRENLY